jgi:tetratricopeptide (TPR) repeat protein
MLLAASSVHRAKAERAEAFGRMAEAAREYEAAYDEDRAPELLFRLGVVRRKLKQYAKAREALRAYLRAAPEGGLRQDVERQLVKLDVLIEAKTEDFSDESPAKALLPLPPPTTIVVSFPSLPTPPLPLPPLPLPPPAAPPPERPRLIVTLPPPLLRVSPLPAPALVRAQSFASKAAPYLAAGAAAAFAAGGYLWWDGNRLSHALDTRYTSGALAAADQQLYGRARSASLAGRALVSGGALLTAGAVVLSW